MKIKEKSVVKGQRLPDNAVPGKPLKYKIMKNWELYLLLLPVVLYYIVFHFVPMYGVLIAFKDYVPGKSVFECAWMGLDNFKRFFGSYYCGRLIYNTITIRLLQIAIGFPAPIILAIMLNEIGDGKFRKAVQNLTFIPHFFSTVVVVSILTILFQSSGVFNQIRRSMGETPVMYMQKPEYFKPMFVLSGVWQNMGWNALVYLGALAGIDPSLYEAASIDGANRLQKIFKVTLPCLMPTIIILFIMNIGNLMAVGFDKAILMQNDLNREASDIISTFVYERGILEFDYSFATAVGLFNSVINVIMLTCSNRISRAVSGSSLW